MKLAKATKKSSAPLSVDERVRLIRKMLREGGSPEHAKDVQRFFKEEVKSLGWYTGALRHFAAAQRREIE